MTRGRQRSVSACASSVLLLGVMACAPVSAPAPAVTLRVTVPTPSGSDWGVAYDYVVANDGADAVYIPTCNATVLPDFALELPDGRRDEISGTICVAIYLLGPVRLTGGAQLSGHAEVQRLPGTRYTPTLRYSMLATGGTYRTAGAESFLVRCSDTGEVTIASHSHRNAA